MDPKQINSIVDARIEELRKLGKLGGPAAPNSLSL